MAHTLYNGGLATGVRAGLGFRPCGVPVSFEERRPNAKSPSMFTIRQSHSK